MKTLENKKDLELFAEEMNDQLDLSAMPMGTWFSATTFGSASCPGSSVGTAGTASSFG
ncbi:thiocillin family RiPP [Oceanobacillus sp. M65]|uniref:thiocillin family RiPP n=1 Tax=Oceanobacillus sp. M65 TaxID=3457435 RepID=UPI00257072BC